MSKGLIVVTGASGFIARHIVLQLLDAGYSVRATVRSPQRAEEVREAISEYVRDSTRLDELLTFALVDLNSDDGWVSALAGANALFHTASPFPLVQPKSEDEIIQPAVEGTLRALRAAKEGGVSRVVLTSSSIAILLAKADGASPIDESIWSNIHDPRANAYAKSKILAEQAAWHFVKDNPDIALTVINPGFVLGAPLGSSDGTSLRVIQRLLGGKDLMLPNIGFPIVDVRDTAEMHVAALQRPETAGKRYLGGDEFLSFPEIAKILKAEFPTRSIPTRRAPSWLIRLLSFLDPEIRSVVPNLDRRIDVTADRARRELGVPFRPASAAVISAGQYVVRNNLV